MMHGVETSISVAKEQQVVVPAFVKGSLSLGPSGRSAGRVPELISPIDLAAKLLFSGIGEVMIGTHFVKAAVRVAKQVRNTRHGYWNGRSQSSVRHGIHTPPHCSS